MDCSYLGASHQARPLVPLNRTKEISSAGGLFSMDSNFSNAYQSRRIERIALIPINDIFIAFACGAV